MNAEWFYLIFDQLPYCGVMHILLCVGVFCHNWFVVFPMQVWKIECMPKEQILIMIRVI